MAVTFKNIMNQSSVIFRGTITGLAESFTPSWDSNKFIGSPFNYYTYTGIERSVTFNLRIYSTNPTEHTLCWQRIEALGKMVYPDIADGSVIVQPPLLMFSLGNPQGGSMYKNRHCFIESLSYNVEDSTPWEIDGGYQAPMVVDAAITLKFIQGVNSSKPLYDFQYLASTAGTQANKDGTSKNNTADNSKKAGKRVKGGNTKDKADSPSPSFKTLPTLEPVKVDSTYVAKPTIKQLIGKSLTDSKKKFQGFGGGTTGGGGAGGTF
jgi:hypothetical protein